MRGKGQIGKRIKGSKYVTDMDKRFTKHADKSKDLVKKSVNKQNDAFDKFRKGKKQKGLKYSEKLKNFENSAAGKKHLARVKKAQGIMDRKTAKSAEGAWKFVQNKIKKDGLSSVIQQIAKKAGWKTAARLSAQGLASGVAGASGFGTAVGIAGGALTAYDIYRILSSE